MHIKSLRLKEFRGFTDLTLTDIPPVRLALLSGPNGTGKSSVFDALLTWSGAQSVGHNWDPTYHLKKSSDQALNWLDTVTVHFHEGTPTSQEALRKLCYFRSAYRNEPELKTGNLGAVPDFAQRSFHRTIDNDAAVSSNYKRLVMQTIRDVWGDGPGRDQSLEGYANSVVSRVNTSLAGVLPHLRMDSLGDPASNTGDFYFTKGISKRYPFKNLSGGEKAVFDMLIDLITKSSYFNDSIICIDEPESHVNPAVHGNLLSELLKLSPPQSQLWVATHSIGMLRRARDIEAKNPGSVAFINFEANFDEPVLLTCTKMDRPTWERSLQVALDDLAALVSPKRIIVCEGGAGEFVTDGLDAQVYTRIFGASEPDTQFFSAGSHAETAKARKILSTLTKGTLPGLEVRRLIDRDDRSEQEVADERANGTRVLSKRNLEAYLFNDEILTLLAKSAGKPEDAEGLLSARDNAIASKLVPVDDYKQVAGETYKACKQLLQLSVPGNNARAFMRDTLAPLVAPGTETFERLRSDIFD
jgi:hypothetical protein